MNDAKQQLIDALAGMAAYSGCTSRAQVVDAIAALVQAIVDDRLAQAIKAPAEQRQDFSLAAMPLRSQGWAPGSPSLEYGDKFTRPGFSGEVQADTPGWRICLTEHEQKCGLITDDIANWDQPPRSPLRYTKAGYYMQKASSTPK